MSIQSTQHGTQVALAPDAMTATLTAPPNVAKSLEADDCAHSLEEAGVKISSDIIQQIQQAIAQYDAQSGKAMFIELHAQQPTQGTDEQLNWSDQCNLKNTTTNDATTENSTVDHYNRSCFVVVESGQVLATLIPATVGEDGMDLAGNAISAKPGKSLDIKHNDHVMLNAKGQFLSTEAGVLAFDHQTISITDCLKINHHVDFTTGNIDFDGDVEIRGGVKDKFVVKTTGDVQIFGLIEAATLLVDGNLDANGGMAAKEKGQLDIKGNLSAHYLNNVSGFVKGNALVKKEIINCDLIVNGKLTIEQGSIIGGRTSVIGGMSVAEIGSSSGEKTLLGIGESTKLSRLIARAMTHVNELEKRLGEISSKLDMLERSGAGGTASQKEELTLFICERDMFTSERDQYADKCNQLMDTQKHICVSEVEIKKILHPGVTIYSGSKKYLFHETIKGPLWIGMIEGRKELILKSNRHPDGVLVSTYARVLDR